MTRYWYIDLSGPTHDAVYGPCDAEEVAEIGEGDGWRWEALTPEEEAEW